MNKLHFILLFSILILFSCNLFKKTNIGLKENNNILLLEKDLIKKVNSQNISPEWTTLNSKITINKQDQENTVNSQIRIK